MKEYRFLVLSSIVSLVCACQQPAEKVVLHVHTPDGEELNMDDWAPCGSVLWHRDTAGIDIAQTVYSVNSNKYLSSLGVDNGKQFLNKEALYESLNQMTEEELSTIAVALNMNDAISEDDDMLTHESEVEIPHFDAEQMYDQAIETFEQLVEIQNLLANEPNELIRDELIAQGQALFDSPQNYVEVQNLSSSDVMRLPIHRYLQRLTRLSRYDQVHIDWRDELEILEEWKEQSPTHNQALASNVQSFNGYNKEMLLYSDHIKKSIALHAHLVEQIDITGQSKPTWTVRIGDIRVLNAPQTTHQNLHS